MAANFQKDVSHLNKFHPLSNTDLNYQTINLWVTIAVESLITIAELQVESNGMH